MWGRWLMCWWIQYVLDLQEPWVNDAVVIGGASAVLSPIIQWGHTILQSKPQVHHPVSRNSRCLPSLKSPQVPVQSPNAVLCIAYGTGCPKHTDTAQCIPAWCMFPFKVPLPPCQAL